MLDGDFITKASLRRSSENPINTWKLFVGTCREAFGATNFCASRKRNFVIDAVFFFIVVVVVVVVHIMTLALQRLPESHDLLLPGQDCRRPHSGGKTAHVAAALTFPTSAERNLVVNLRLILLLVSLYSNSASILVLAFCWRNACEPSALLAKVLI